MAIDPKVEHALSRYKQARDALLHSDESSFGHHVAEFFGELRRNTLTKPILEALPSFDVNAWLKPIAERWQRTREPARFAFPESEDERLVIYLDFIESFAAGDDEEKFSVDSLGTLLNLRGDSKAVAAAIDMIVRPFCERLQERLHKAAAIANPAIREVAGVPTNMIPAPNETFVFLSHKTADKQLVLLYHEALEELGYKPWLDQHEMKPGDVVHRGISQGFDGACAVVFFITKNFVDEKWLAMEIDEAINRKVNRGDRFAIITLLFDGAPVPRALERFVFHKVDNQVEALRQVIRGLPVVLGPVRWRK